MKKKSLNWLRSLGCALACTSSVNAQPFPFLSMPDLGSGQALVQTGAYWSHQGKAQHINIETLIGDQFTVSKHGNSNALFGFGYLFNGPQYGCTQLNFGVNAYYLPKTSVSGYVIQEDLFTNLSYGYYVRHFPVYAVLEAASSVSQLPGTFLSQLPGSLAIDVGIGPNFSKASGFMEDSLDGITIPDNAFGGHATTNFSVTAGAKLIVPNVFGQMSLECGYRFFYFGNNHLSRINDQILNRLKTGNSYAHAVVVGLRI